MSLNILITGTNSGFGRLTALALARRGHNVFATMRDTAGRNEKAAAELRQIAEAETLKLDVVEMRLTDSDSVNAAVKLVLEKTGHLDVVVNNAGRSLAGLQETATPEQLLEQLDINVVAPHRVARAVLPSMRARGQGLLLQISSELGRLVMPFMGSYCGAKAALESMFEAYAYELKPLGVEVALVQPGAFPTDFTKNGSLGTDVERAKGYGPMENGAQQFFAGLDQMMTGPNAPHPDEVAEAVVKLIETPAGTRPFRVVVDKMMGAMVEGLNSAHAQVQKGILTGLGMGNLAV
jgi:NAD(P)-dependent dehydrogenase (short-subunit alcohol dehydrogenase family)